MRIAKRWAIGMSVGFVAAVSFEWIVFTNVPEISPFWTTATMVAALLLFVGISLAARVA